MFLVQQSSTEMKPKYKIHEVFYIANAFVMDKGVRLQTETKDSVQAFNLTKSTIEGKKYSIIVTQPLDNSTDRYGKVYFQNDNCAPVLMAQTDCKIPKQKSIFAQTLTKMTSYQYSVLLNSLNKRNENKLKTYDNTIQVLDAILQMKEMQR